MINEGGATAAESVLKDDVDATYIWMSSKTGLGTLKTHMFTVPSFAKGAVSNVTVYVEARKADAGALAYAYTAISDGTTIDYGSAHLLGTNYVEYSKSYNNSPFTGSGWSLDEMQNLEIGARLSSDSTNNYTSRCTRVYAKITLDVTSVSQIVLPSGTIMNTSKYGVVRVE